MVFSNIIIIIFFFWKNTHKSQLTTQQIHKNILHHRDPPLPLAMSPCLTIEQHPPKLINQSKSMLITYKNIKQINKRKTQV